MNLETLNEWFHLDQTNWRFYWRKKPCRGIKAGALVGPVPNSNGYLTTAFRGTMYLQHQLVWLAMTGEWPSDKIDHIDGNPSNNDFSNLRVVPHGVNMQNKRKAMKNNKTGYLGVSKRADRDHYIACIMVDKKHKYLGGHKTPEEAYEAYLKAKRLLHKGNTL
jgi:hypothetical protein